MAMLLSLEDFDASSGLSDPLMATQPQELPGYEEGFAAGQAQLRSEQQQIDAALVQTLADMSFAFAEARQHVLQGLAPLFAALVDQLLPGIVDQSFRARLGEHLLTLAEDRSKAPVRLIVHPTQIEAVASLIPTISGLEIDLNQDPEVGLHGALISQGNAEALLDLDDLVAEVRRTLSALFDLSGPEQETTEHG